MNSARSSPRSAMADLNRMRQRRRGRSRQELSLRSRRSSPRSASAALDRARQEEGTTVSNPILIEIESDSD